MKNVVVFDLDGTVINSEHRTPNKDDGTLDIEKYLSLRNRENLFRDSLLPLVSIMRKLFKHNYIVIATARCVDHDDYDFLAHYNIPYHKMISRPWGGNYEKDAKLKRRQLQRLRNLKQFRNKPWFMFDDARPVISEMRQIGIICLNSIKINERLQK
jgi:hypothetical protein